MIRNLDVKITGVLGLSSDGHAIARPYENQRIEEFAH